MHLHTIQPQAYLIWFRRCLFNAIWSSTLSVLFVMRSRWRFWLSISLLIASLTWLSKPTVPLIASLFGG